MVLFIVGLVVFCVLPTTDADVAGELAHMLSSYPEADADRDGTLTGAEAGEYILRKFQRKRPNRGTGIRDRSLIKVYEARTYKSMPLMKYTELRGVKHNSWIHAFTYDGDDASKGFVTRTSSESCDSTDNIWEWLFRQHKGE